MWSLIFAVAGGLCLAFAVAFGLAARRGSRRQEELGQQLRDAVSRLQEIEKNYQSKCRQCDQQCGQIEQLREELSRAKKKLFESEKKIELLQKEAPPVSELDQQQALEKKLEEARAEAASLRERLEQTGEKFSRLEAERDKLRTQLEAAHQQAVSERAGESEKIKRLENECSKLREKLESARRKARNDEQVYRVTKSKLELALEKIAMLEKAKGPTRQEEATQANLPTGDSVS